MNTTTKRNYGIDTLRLVSMFLVTTLHVLGHGGVLSHATGAAFRVSWLLESIAYCAVNCFGIISGYVGYSEEKKAYRFTKYVSIWLQVVFYSFGIRFLCYIFWPELLEGRSLVTALTPISASLYWYMNAYTGLFFVVPWINQLVRQCSKQEMNRLALVLFLVFSCYANFARDSYGDVFRLGGGYSFIWLVILYLIGAWLKKCSIPEKVNVLPCMISIAGCVMLTWLPIAYFTPAQKIFLSYISPTVLFMAVFLVIGFSKIQYGTIAEKIIKTFSPAALGVYLLQEQLEFRDYIMKGGFVFIADAPAWQIPFLVLGAAGAIFLLGICVEKIRLTLFKVLRINAGAEKLVGWMYEKVVRMVKG